jgi:hypothetical protein
MSTIQTPPPGSGSSSERGKFRRATLTSGASGKCGQLIFADMCSAISSLGLVVGALPCDLPAGPTINPSGLEVAPVSRSVPPEKYAASWTPGIYGPSGLDSSQNVADSTEFQRSLENRLRARMAVYGSPEYELAWKHWAVNSGPPICALRASARRTSDSGFGGWPTPAVANAIQGGENIVDKRARDSKTGLMLTDVAASCIAGWPTPQACQGPNNSTNRGKDHGGERARMTPQNVADLVGWATPSSRDWKDTPGMSTTGVNPDGSIRNRTDQLPRQAALGMPSISSPASMEKRGALNPEHSRWLMGYPAAWGSCGATAMQSCRKSRRNSSKPPSNLSAEK